MIPPEIINKCKELDEEYREFTRYAKKAKKSGIASGLSILGAMIAASIQLSHVQYITVISSMLAITSLITFIIAIVYNGKSRKHTLDNLSLSILNAYYTHDLLEKHKKGAKLSSRINEIKKQLKNMRYNIAYGWGKFSYDNKVIPQLAEAVTIFIKNLRGISLAINEKNIDIDKLQNSLEELMKFLSSKEPHDFNAINTILNDYGDIQKQTISFKQIIQNNKFVRYPLVYGGIVGIGGVITLISSFFTADVNTRIILWATISVALLVILHTRSR